MREGHDSQKELEAEANKAFSDGDPRRALGLVKQIRDNDPQDPELESDFIFKLHFLDLPYASVNLELARYRELFEPHGKRTLPAHKRKANGKIRIGYLSPDIYNQASHYILLPILRNHNRAQFEIVVYCTHSAYDEATQEIQKYADAWRTIDHNNYELLLDTIEEDEIDILVDLAGHTGINSLPVFAERAAPVQVSWFGYMGSTGLLNMDYRLTDEWRVPKDKANEYTEHLFYLPNSYTFSPFEKLPEESAPPSLTEDHVTFGSLNSHIKLTREVKEAWAEILHQNPSSRLVVFACPDLDYAHAIKQFFESRGISSDRIEPHPRKGMADFLSSVTDIDIALDPFPYTGGVTTYHALSVGVPSLTLLGSHEYGRNCGAIMEEAGLPQFITRSKTEYISRAGELAHQKDLLQKLRITLPGELRKRTGSIVPHVEDAYREMDRRARITNGEKT